MGKEHLAKGFDLISRFIGQLTLCIWNSLYAIIYWKFVWIPFQWITLPMPSGLYLCCIRPVLLDQERPTNLEVRQVLRPADRIECTWRERPQPYDVLDENIRSRKTTHCTKYCDRSTQSGWHIWCQWVTQSLPDLWKSCYDPIPRRTRLPRRSNVVHFDSKLFLPLIPTVSIIAIIKV